MEQSQQTPQKAADDVFIGFIDKRLEAEKDEYHSMLESWQVYKARIKRQSLDNFHVFIEKVIAGVRFLIESDKFTMQERDALAIIFDNLSEQTLKDQQQKSEEKTQKMPYEVFGIDPMYLEKGYDIAMEEVTKGNLDNAMNLFFLFTYLDPSTYQFWLGLGICHATKGDHSTALILYNIAIPTSGKDCLTVMLCMSDSFVALDSFSEADQVLNEVLKIASEQGGCDEIKSNAQAKLDALAELKSPSDDS